MILRRFLPALLALGWTLGCGGGSDPSDHPADIQISAGNGQTAGLGSPVPIDPSVLVTNETGRPLPGISVTFAVASGGGVATGAVASTGSDGIARVGQWNLGTVPGPNTLTASVVGLPSVTFTATATTIVSAYAIDLRFLGTMTTTQIQAFQSARNRLQNVILGDVPNIPVNRPAGDCLPNQPALNETVDDLIIFAEVAAIDGPGMVLGQAGPCIIRTSGNLPVVGIMQFDVADLDNLEQAGLLQAVILHEMLHVIGFGSIWTNRGLLSGGTTTDPFFTGSQAVAAFDGIGGTAFVGNRVPVEGTGGPGTRTSHWRETVFKNELMTGFLNNGSNPLSIVTIASLADMGYVVDSGEDDAFVIAPPFTAPPAGRLAPVLLVDDGWKGPLFEVDPSGAVRRIPRP
jgi:hypothetical protein